MQQELRPDGPMFADVLSIVTSFEEIVSPLPWAVLQWHRLVHDSLSSPLGCTSVAPTCSRLGVSAYLCLPTVAQHVRGKDQRFPGKMRLISSTTELCVDCSHGLWAIYLSGDDRIGRTIVLALSDTDVVSSNPTRGKVICLFLFCYPLRRWRTRQAWSPSQGPLPTLLRITKPEKLPRPSKWLQNHWWMSEWMNEWRWISSCL
jgi:hypothetical protein